MAGPAKVVVAGAGLAGLRVVEELRGREYAGAVTLIGAEERPPYDRPPLSKKVMTGELDDTELRADLGPLAVDVRLGESATELRDNVLRTDAADDALAIRSLLKQGRSLVIVGAGWIGAELATAAAGRGCRVTVLEAAQTP